MLFFFDTETTGKFDFKANHFAPHQPRIIQIGAIVKDENGKTRGELNCLIKPDGWEISQEAEAIHGISLEHCERHGVPITMALRMVHSMLAGCAQIIAHNLPFDHAMVIRECGLIKRTQNPSEIHIFDGKQHFCTMQESTDILKIPSPYGGYKWPKLAEAYQYFMGKELVDAHDAMADIRATADVFFAMRNQTTEVAS